MLSSGCRSQVSGPLVSLECRSLRLTLHYGETHKPRLVHLGLPTNPTSISNENRNKLNDIHSLWANRASLFFPPKGLFLLQHWRFYIKTFQFCCIQQNEVVCVYLRLLTFFFISGEICSESFLPTAWSHGADDNVLMWKRRSHKQNIHSAQFPGDIRH